MRSKAFINTVFLLALAACSSTPVSETKPETMAATKAPPARAPAAGTQSAAPTPVEPARPVRLDHLDPNSVLARERSIYFDFDAAAVRREYMPLIERHGQYLRGHQAIRIVIEGHTDERGGSEYNLALGQRRAEAVGSALRLLGVKDTQMEAISYGEEKPVALNHDEVAWQKNRRADIVYPK